MLKHISIPYTPNGLELDLTVEQEENCRVLYKYVKDDLYEFAGFYDPEKNDADYPDGMLALPVRSVFGGVSPIKAGTSVWNVVGSSGDPWNKNTSPKWIQIWKNELTKEGHPHTKKCYVENSAGITCNTPICSGHMVLTDETGTPKFFV